jgi:hypothetical protein
MDFTNTLYADVLFVLLYTIVDFKSSLELVLYVWFISTLNKALNWIEYMHTLIHVSYTNRAPPMKTLKRKVEMNQKIKSMLQSSDKGSYYNYLLLGILGIFFCSFFYITIFLINWFLKISYSISCSSSYRPDKSTTLYFTFYYQLI